MVERVKRRIASCLTLLKLKAGDIPKVPAELRPDYTAQIFQDRESTYKELDQRSNQIANRLIECGLENKLELFIGKTLIAISSSFLALAKQT